MKKLLFFFYALAFAFIFSSCEELGELVGNKVEIESPYTDIVVSNFVCEGYTVNGDVYIDFDVVSTEADLRVWFGSAYAYIDDDTYKAPFIGYVDLFEDKKTKITYWGDTNSDGDYCCFERISTKISHFDEIEVAIIVDGIEDVKYIKFKNVQIDWKDNF
ncbi:MAG: hypothetical protein J6B65_01250 [Paludibacteraceae bacterium]|nr:hypothetical protein [Paludibacteraceae bacterium]